MELNDEVLKQIGSVAKEAVADGLKEADIASVKTELAEAVKQAQSLDDRFNDLASAEKVTETGLYKAVSDKITETVEAELKSSLASMREQASQPNVPDAEIKVKWETCSTVNSNGAEVPNYTFTLPVYMDKAAATDSTVQKSVPGHAVTQAALWTAMIEQNPFRPWIMIHRADSGSFKVPNMQRKTFTKAAGDPGVQVYTQTPGTIQPGTNVVVEEYEQTYPVSLTTLADLDGIHQRLTMNVVEDYAHTQGEETFSVIKTNIASSSSGTGQSVNTGVAANLPTVANILAKLDEVTEMIPSPYRMGGVIQISRKTNRRIAQGLRAAGGLAGVPGTTMMEFDGFPVVINDHLDDGDAANDLSLVAGNLMRAVHCAEREDLTIEQYDQTAPGAVVYYARGRFIPYIVDATGLVGLITKA